MQTATKLLIGNGHTNIALVTGLIDKDGVVEKRFGRRGKAWRLWRPGCRKGIDADACA